MWLVIAFIIAFSISAVAQPNKKDLENKKKKLQDDIKYTSKLLNETRASQKTTLKELVTLKKQIGQREQLINNLKDEVGLLDNQIGANQQSYDSLQTVFNNLKAEFARVVNFTYKYRHNASTLSYLLGGDDFTRAYNRTKYLNLYAKYRKQQVAKIQAVQAQIKLVNDKITTDRQNRVGVLNMNETQKRSLDKDKKQQEKVIGDLKKTEANLKAQLNKKKAEAAKLSSAINTIIENDIKKSKAVAKKPTTPTKPGSKPAKVEPIKENVITLTPEAKLTSTGFENNKGRLPWPVEKGFVSSSFGNHPHPVLTGITTNNNGIDITTDKGATVRAIFDGEVSGVVSIPGAGQAVIIRHGEYLTVYSNLGSVSVSKGAKVKAKQSIGTVGDGDNGPEIHLEVWKNKTKLNPQGWIIAK